MSRSSVNRHSVRLKRGVRARFEWRSPCGEREHTPLVIAYVELEEGPRMLTNLVDCDPEGVAIGMPVEVRFDDTGEGSAVPRFAPA